MTTLREFTRGLACEASGKTQDAHKHLERLGLKLIRRDFSLSLYESRKKRGYATDDGNYQIFRR